MTLLLLHILFLWDVFCKQPGRIWRDHTGDVATDQDLNVY